MSEETSTESAPQERWTAVDRYITDLLLPEDPALDAALTASAAAGLPPIAVTPNQGKLLGLLARVQGARTILELGTLGGYSTIWLARALPAGGRLVTLEAEAEYAEIARANIARAGFAETVELRVGPALQTLPQLVSKGAGPFDLIFIDADKKNNPSYFEWSLKLSRPGTLIIVDNVVRDGAILDPDADDPTLGNEGSGASGSSSRSSPPSEESMPPPSRRSAPRAMTDSHSRSSEFRSKRPPRYALQAALGPAQHTGQQRTSGAGTASHGPPGQ